MGSIEIDIDHLHIVDSRTNKEYDIPIDNNFIRAADLSQVVALNGDGDAQKSQPLGVFDHGYEHTACMESAITYL